MQSTKSKSKPHSILNEQRAAGSNACGFLLRRSDLLNRGLHHADDPGESVMPLTSEEFESLFQFFVPSGNRDHSDQRKHLRIQLSATATILPIAHGKNLKPLIVRLCDISRKGLRLIDAHAFQPGDQFLLCLVSADYKTTRAIFCVVRRAEQTSNGMYRVGCEFLDDGDQTLPTDTVAAGLKRFQKLATTAEEQEEAA
jgi:hypothetical protein